MSGRIGGPGEVLGASSIAAGSIYLLPYTGNSILPRILTFLAIILSLAVLASFTYTRLLRKILSKF